MQVDIKSHRIVSLGILSVLLACAWTLALVQGSFPLSLSQLWDALWFEGSASAELVLWQLRIPRALLAICAGAALGISGATIQGLFRNPLASPGLIGVSSGAALAAVAFIVLGAFANDVIGLPVAAFLGGLTSTAIIARIAKGPMGTSVVSMLLAGVAFNAIGAAGIGLLSYMADDNALRRLTFWTLGSLSGANWKIIALVAPVTVFGALFLCIKAKTLNALLLGESEARHLGVSVEKVKAQLIFVVALVVAVSVAYCGIIGFVGLVVPHLMRMLLGSDHRLLLPASALGGGLLLLLADILSRVVLAPSELPIGIVTALIGGPFFIFLIIRNRQQLGVR